VEGPPIDGIVLVDKPAGITSHDVVSVVRRALAVRRVGHAGTLDPFATGLLVLLIGHATRLLPYLASEPKVYEATIAFGAETDTDDVTGAVVREAALPDPSAVRRAIAALTGVIDQVPPSYSAKHVAGRRAYDAARRGEAVALAPARVTVHDWCVRSLDASGLEATITCSGGTYIRALARDLGRFSGSAAHLAALRRTRSGPFTIRDAVTLEIIRAGGATVNPPLSAVPHLPLARLTGDDVARVRQGRTVAGTGTADDVGALVDEDGHLVAVAERVGDAWQPRVVLPHA
jgi:tRNA pseudouridine55 synthase